MIKKLFWCFLLAGGISMLVMSYHYLISDNTGILINKEISNVLWYRIAFKLHVSFGLVAILTGPFQFIFKPKRHLKAHKARGYLYAFSILISGVAGLFIAPYSMGGMITSVGFTLLSSLWLIITILSIWTAINHKIKEHRSFTIFSYSLTFAAITQRTLLLVPLLTSVPFMPVYQLSAWLPWMMNLAIAYLILRNKRIHQKE